MPVIFSSNGNLTGPKAEIGIVTGASKRNGVVFVKFWSDIKKWGFHDTTARECSPGSLTRIRDIMSAVKVRDRLMPRCRPEVIVPDFSPSMRRWILMPEKP